MKKRYWAAPLAAVAVVAAGVGYAVELHPPHVGSSCPDGFLGTYHFVANQIPDDSVTGSLTATWDSGDMCDVTAYKVNLHTQHYRCVDMAGALLSATSTVGGKLVLSDFTCRRIKKCDPETQKCET